MEPRIGAHPLEEQRLRLYPELYAPEQAAGGAPGVPFLRVEQEPVLVIKLLLRDVSEKRQ